MSGARIVSTITLSNVQKDLDGAKDTRMVTQMIGSVLTGRRKLTFKGNKTRGDEMDGEKVVERIHEAIDTGVCVDLFMDILALLKEQNAEKKCCRDCEYYGACHDE